MNPDLSPLAQHASLIDGQRPERLTEVHERIGVARRRRRHSAVGAAAVAAAAVVAAVAVATGGVDRRSIEPANPDDVPRRVLTYAEGNTIHYGDRSIDVGEEVQFLTVTDDGVAFVHEPNSAQSGDKPLWFTDGSTVERIGTTFGSPAVGYRVEASDTGSLLVVRDADDGTGRPYQSVIDTSTGYLIHEESAEYGGKDVVLLSLHSDAIYWAYSADTPCDLVGELGCLQYRWALRYDVATGARTRVAWAQYDEDLRSRPRTIVGPDPGAPPVPGTFAVDDLVFERQGTELIAQSHDGARELALSVARTGKPIQLRVQEGVTEATRFEFSQWLDDDRLVLFAYAGSWTEAADEGDIFVCALSTGTCRLELPGQPGTAYQLPALD